MAETREVFDPFEQKTVEIRNDLVLRLRGKYATGPTLPNGEPEFGWREFPVPPIQKEAADEIERLLAENVDKARAWDASAKKNAKIKRLRAALTVARKFVNDHGPEEPGDQSRKTNDMLALIDDALLNG